VWEDLDHLAAIGLQALDIRACNVSWHIAGIAHRLCHNTGAW
jgi:hypothetical protein